MNKLKWADTGECPECKHDLILHHTKNGKVDESICTNCSFQYSPQLIGQDELPANKIVSSEPLAVYVIEGPLEGWHNFNKYDESVEFCEKLMKADWEFVFDPNW